MPLVDYSSDSAEDDSQPPPSKRQKAHSSHVVESKAAHRDRRRSGPGIRDRSKKDTADPSDLPPLPSAFHDLYASTVRQSVVDDPSLHHGRRRQIPHVVGNWPSHLYVEWYPTAAQHAMLSELLDHVQTHLDHVELHNFLVSDLGAPLPLHISLSRPLALSTNDKDVFLGKITHSLQASAMAPFAVRPMDLFWFRSPDSNRTFLVLRVASSKTDDEHLNPELLGLLTRCNELAKAFGLPTLYQRDQTEQAGNAFHLSIGWTFDHPDDSVTTETLKLLDKTKFAPIRTWEIDVAGVKAKIGNTVNHIALDGSRKSDAGSRLLES